MKNKETLEEVAEREIPNRIRSTPFGSKFEWEPRKERKAFIRGAKWQQEQNKNLYSEEEVVNILIKAYIDIQKRKISNQAVLASWFEQFKKK